MLPVPRPWFEQSVATLNALAQDTYVDGAQVLLPGGRPVPDVRLAEGTHLKSGAVYEAHGEDLAAPQERMVVKEWDGASRIRVQQHLKHEEMSVFVEAALRSAAKPEDVEVRVETSGRSTSARLMRTSSRAHLRLDTWWRAVSCESASTVPLEMSVEHRLGRAAVRVAPHRTGGSWELRCTLSVHACLPLRPLVAIGIWFARRRIGRAFAEAVDQAAGRWNTAIPTALALRPDQLRAQVMAALQAKTEAGVFGSPDSSAPP
ncbi:hypothetical protein [Streptomyces sp. NBC_01304]|uniref:hypothetical protein n=1 Tax=Streptomyces sp. NBC_01304 TaxID=2903818 RepID=UPI002E11BB70|nr:hypothetical protein OG430_23355 [Streptomyces sp. NBC_01304]